MKEMSDLICGKAAVGGNYNSTRDINEIQNLLDEDLLEENRKRKF